jgi:pilus assembly protein CpaE
MNALDLTGRRVVAIGANLAPLAAGPLFGVILETAEVERLAHLTPGACDLVLIDADGAKPEALAAGIGALAAMRDPPPTLLIGAHLPAGLVRSLLRIARSDVMEAPFTPDHLAAVVRVLLAAPAAPAPNPGVPGRSRCWAVTGAVGGAGATTVAVELAGLLAARNGRDRGVCLVDLNLADGAAAAYLGVKGALPLGEIGAGAERVDAGLLLAFATQVGKRLDLLACPRDPSAFDYASREVVLRILELACETYDTVIVDVPRHRRPWTLEVLAGSDEVLVVSELTVPALLAARAYSDEVEAALPAGPKPRIVLNRTASRMFGPAPSLVEAERALQRKADAGIASDWEAAAASVNLGGPISQHRPKSKIVRDVEALVERLLADDTARAAKTAKAVQAARAA